jgi:tRNA modification GTPase
MKSSTTDNLCHATARHQDNQIFKQRFDTNMEGGFLARRRHLQALEEVRTICSRAKPSCYPWAGELLAEELPIAMFSRQRIADRLTS